MQNGWIGKKLGAAAVIFNAADQVLLVKHSYGKLNWELPGGAVEAEEAVADAAIREVREETGLLVTAERLTGIYYMAEDDSHHFVFQCLVAHEGQMAMSISDETTDCGYFSPDALPRPISDFTVRRVQDALAQEILIQDNLAGQTALLPVPIGPRQWLE